jgi:L-alanine-DL-glutamate epimerase-like enolase superfamily enzyme
VRNLGRSGLAAAAISAFDAALWDLRAKLLGFLLPLLLERCRETVPIYGSGFTPIRTSDRAADRVRCVFRWFVGLGIEDPVWDAMSFTKIRDRLLAGDVAQKSSSPWAGMACTPS